MMPPIIYSEMACYDPCDEPDDGLGLLRGLAMAIPPAVALWWTLGWLIWRSVT